MASLRIAFPMLIQLRPLITKPTCSIEAINLAILGLATCYSMNTADQGWWWRIVFTSLLFILTPLCIVITFVELLVFDFFGGQNYQSICIYQTVAVATQLITLGLLRSVGYRLLGPGKKRNTGNAAKPHQDSPSPSELPSAELDETQRPG